MSYVLRDNLAVALRLAIDSLKEKNLEKSAMVTILTELLADVRKGEPIEVVDSSP